MTQRLALLILSCFHWMKRGGSFQASQFHAIPPSRCFVQHNKKWNQMNPLRRNVNIQLQMGMFDFLKKRNNDFVKLESSATFGPGPLLILYNVPSDIDDDEVMDMIHDGAPIAHKQGVKLQRIQPEDLTTRLGEKTVETVLREALQADYSYATKAETNETDEKMTVPILYFSGFNNSEMMSVYNIIAQEIYMETQGLANAACAKAVEPAMKKPFRQLLEEISGDHLQAIQGE